MLRPFEFLAATVALAMSLAVVAPAAASDPIEPDRVAFLLEYVGSDYPNAVHAGTVVDDAEYREVQRFLAIATAALSDLTARGASPEAVAGVQRLVQLVADRGAESDVRRLVDETAPRLLREIPGTALPSRTPDLGHGARLFADACAPCHGPAGRGDGHLAPGMLPAPISLRAARTIDMSPHQIFAAMRFGVDGTAMPSFDAACTTDDLWDLAFFVPTLRDGFAPRAADPGLPVDLRTLTVSSTSALLAEWRAKRPETSLADVDHYRAHPGPVAATPDAVAAAPAGGPGPEGASLAGQLESTFAEVGARVLPSVVGVSAFARRAGAAATVPSAGAGRWTVATGEDDVYPGFRRTRSASGFVVSADGDILTCSDVLLGRDGRPVEVVDVEYRDGEHLLARIVGIEPTIHLGVVRPEVLPARGLPPIPPVTIGDSDQLRTGHWTIGLGDPWGPSTAFGVGVMSSEPTRQCYQENLTSTLVQSSMRIHPEAYGGPMTNIRGEVVGVLVPPPGIQPLKDAPAATFALPINVAMGIYKSLLVKQSTVSPWLGFAVLEIPVARTRLAAAGVTRTLAPTGVYIDDLFTPSPAAAGDVRVGDCLVALDGRRLLSVLDFQQALYLAGVGRRVALDLVRDGQPLRKQLTVERRPPTATLY